MAVMNAQYKHPSSQYSQGLRDLIDAMLKVHDVNDTVLKRSLDDDEVLGRLSTLIMRSLYQRFRADELSSD